MSGVVKFSFGLNLAILKFIGLYPSKEYATLHRVYAVVLFAISMTPTLVLGTLHFVFIEDLANTDYDDYALVSMICFTIKLMTFLRNSVEIRKCIEYFDDYVAVNSDQRSIVEECIFVCKRNTLVFLGGCLVGVAGIIGPTFIEGKLENLPLNLWMPRVWKETPLVHYCICLLLILGILYATAACGTIDPLIGGLSLHTAAQLQILGHCLQFLDQDEENICDISRNRNIYKKIKIGIQQYQSIVNFVHKYQNCFSPVMFIQFMGSVLIIAFCCFQLSEMKVDVKFFITLLTLGLLFFEIFFYCYYGTLLIEENDSLSRAIYTSRWYEYDEQSKRALVVLMTRLQKPLFVTAGKILALSLETFTLILKRSYSLLAVLKNY